MVDNRRQIPTWVWRGAASVISDPRGNIFEGNTSTRELGLSNVMKRTAKGLSVIHRPLRLVRTFIHRRLRRRTLPSPSPPHRSRSTTGRRTPSRPRKSHRILSNVQSEFRSRRFGQRHRPKRMSTTKWHEWSSQGPRPAFRFSEFFVIILLCLQSLSWVNKLVDE